jgi:hypothetical protein
MVLLSLKDEGPLNVEKTQRLHTERIGTYKLLPLVTHLSFHRIIPLSYHIFFLLPYFLW